MWGARVSVSVCLCYYYLALSPGHLGGNACRERDPQIRTCGVYTSITPIRAHARPHGRIHGRCRPNSHLISCSTNVHACLTVSPPRHARPGSTCVRGWNGEMGGMGVAAKMLSSMASVYTNDDDDDDDDGDSDDGVRYQSAHCECELLVRNQAEHERRPLSAPTRTAWGMWKLLIMYMATGWVTAMGARAGRDAAARLMCALANIIPHVIIMDIAEHKQHGLISACHTHVYS